MTPLCSIMYVGPGVTTYQGLNLGFRFYTVDGDYNDSTHAVLDHEVYILDMGQANRDNNPHWVWEYSAKVRGTTLFICNYLSFLQGLHHVVCIQWHLWMIGPNLLSFVERLSSFRGYKSVDCPLLRCLSSFRVSFITIFN